MGESTNLDLELNLHYPQEKYDEEEDDVLSFCDLPLSHSDCESETRPSSPIKTNHFEFCTTNLNPSINNPNGVVFCGKIIGSAKPRCKNPFLFRSDSLKKFSPVQSVKSMGRSRSVTGNHQYCSGSSTSSGNQLKILFGLSRIQPQLDLNEIKKRQSRRAPRPLVPAGGDVEMMISGTKRGGGGKSWWGLLRPFAKASLGCIPLV
ncbi:DNA-directed RNA polymerase subunit beta like [Quillaja saponaria]|uniref:DNA-directed RNA polymerase subunit beta like n=1 Tax=Quillaja saponaria TaxID=32244 RepID=A0AAD7Q5A0_QUISA|nr:DNA-directed RNA polymerase subunit beta like [Quillaja saponaria]